MVVNILGTNFKNHTLSARFAKEYFFGGNLECLLFLKRRIPKYYFLIVTFVPIGVYP